MNSPPPVPPGLSLTRRRLLSATGALNRSTALPAAELPELRTRGRLPAVKGDQITPWSMEERYSHAGYAPVLEQLAAAVTKSRRPAR
ncbi:hypothetical protein [Streptomyces niveus]|uniref:hypothetical protein n=1 Tax=Streptomyces niveus TaxID=193462 RepID=UPI0003C5E443|nr:hypothetical protein [Streptomyces niveus]EST20880.1 hypothetical protein M877_32990 [Streptomyces niveus NCIMB 11891]